MKVFRICEHCNKEYEVLMHMMQGGELVWNFGPCPKCEKRDDVWIKIVEKEFPMQNGPPIPWSLAEKIYEKYTDRYGFDQTLEELGARGGFGWAEVKHLWKGR